MIYANREARKPPDEIFHSLLCLDFGLFRYDSFGLHFLNGFDMIIMIHIREAVIVEVYLEAGLKQIHACVAYTEFGRDAADMDVGCVEEVENFS
jgi:hypothetical protein